MIELKNDSLVVSFPDLHPAARLTIGFQRTLRIPDDGKNHALPPGLGRFPLRHVDDYAERVPATWKAHGGVMLPMHATEAMWLNFRSDSVPKHGHAWPFALKVATGKRSAVTGEAWRQGLPREPKQDYLVIPSQPWLDGYCVADDVIRQFVAMRLGEGYTVEEQLTELAEVGGLQLEVFPMKEEAFLARWPEQVFEDMELCRSAGAAPPMPMAAAPRKRSKKKEMGLAPGGRMKQTIHKDPYREDEWDLSRSSRCFVHLLDAASWQAVTGSPPPTKPPTAKDYSNAGLPWFHLDESNVESVGGSKLLAGLKSVLGMGQAKGEQPLPENEPVDAPVVVDVQTGKRVGDVVRESTF
jgi:hypothetical protein